jgi:restriction system protein
MQASSIFVVLIVVWANLSGRHHIDVAAAWFALAVLIALALAYALGFLPDRKDAWRRALHRHAPALAKRYRQLVRVNAYGYTEHDKWLDELDRFRVSTRLKLRRADLDLFDAWATRAIKAIVERQDERHDVVDEGREDELEPGEYEHHCADLLRRAGWQAEVTGQSGDQGIDILASMGDIVVAVQCKLYFANAIGNKAVQEAHAAAGFVDASHAVVASNAQYTRSAEQLAAKLGVLLLHHSELPELQRLLAERDADFGRRRSA